MQQREDAYRERKLTASEISSIARIISTDEGISDI